MRMSPAGAFRFPGFLSYDLARSWRDAVTEIPKMSYALTATDCLKSQQFLIGTC